MYANTFESIQKSSWFECFFWYNYFIWVVRTWVQQAMPRFGKCFSKIQKCLLVLAAQHSNLILSIRQFFICREFRQSEFYRCSEIFIQFLGTKNASVLQWCAIILRKESNFNKLENILFKVALNCSVMSYFRLKKQYQLSLIRFRLDDAYWTIPPHSDTKFVLMIWMKSLHLCFPYDIEYFIGSFIKPYF